MCDMGKGIVNLLDEVVFTVDAHLVEGVTSLEFVVERRSDAHSHSDIVSWL